MASVTACRTRPVSLLVLLVAVAALAIVVLPAPAAAQNANDCLRCSTWYNWCVAKCTPLGPPANAKCVSRCQRSFEACRYHYC